MYHLNFLCLKIYCSDCWKILCLLCWKFGKCMKESNATQDSKFVRKSMMFLYLPQKNFNLRKKLNP